MLWTTCVPDAYRSQKRASDLKLIAGLVSYHAGAGN